MNVDIQLLDSSLPEPGYAHPGDAGLDLRARIDGSLKPFERKTVPCGFSLAIPEGYAGLVIPRSGLASKHGISVVNGPGLVDSGYRGEICVVLVNLDPTETFYFAKGDRIAQLMIVAVPNVSLHNTYQLSESDRGGRGFGSSGLQ